MFRLLTDFNEIDGDRVRGLVEDLEGPRPITVGDRLLVYDGGDEAAGTVERIDHGLVYVIVDWSTFGPARRIHSGPHGVWWAARGDYRLMEDEQPTMLDVLINGARRGDKTLA
jgi:hypothetical protein